MEILNSEGLEAWNSDVQEQEEKNVSALAGGSLFFVLFRHPGCFTATLKVALFKPSPLTHPPMFSGNTFSDISRSNALQS